MKLKYFIVKLIQTIYPEIRLLHNTNDIRKILVIRLDEIGDVVMTTPFLRELRRNFPNSEITLIVKSQTYNLVELCPYVNTILTFNIYIGRLSFLINILKSYLFSIKYLMKEQFDLAIIPRWDTDIYGASYIAYFSKSRIRVAYSENVSDVKTIVNKGFDGFYTDVIKKTCHLHEVERNLDVIRFLGGKIENNNLEEWLDTNDINFITEEEACNIKLVVTTATSKEDKEWNINNYIEIINNLTTNFAIDIILIGSGKRAKEQSQLLTRSCYIKYNLVNKTSLRESLKLLKQADCYLGADTGPTHLAALAGIRGVALFSDKYSEKNAGYNCPERFGPWKSNLHVLTPINTANGINGITVDEVYKIIKMILLEIKTKNN